ncbi:MAG TPA: VIT1/CCC1 transporter family protein [Candidatus Saccharimonadales bacterium]|nr:VIT1/CCC1 transporter family protein [Candidatus Saccharimonadales bacterium]
MSERGVEANGHQHSSKGSSFSDFILGSQDGLVNVLGIILGMSAATRDVRLILVATLAALGAESVSMGAVGYTSTVAKRRLYLSAVNRETKELKEVSNLGYEEALHVLRGWGFSGKELEEGARRVAANPKAMLDLMMSYGLKMSPVAADEPRRSFLVVLGSTFVGSAIPIIPFIISGRDVIAGAMSSVVLSGVVLFFIGWYDARVTVGSVWKSGLQMLVIGLTAGFAGFLIGHFLGAPP